MPQVTNSKAPALLCIVGRFLSVPVHHHHTGCSCSFCEVQLKKKKNPIFAECKADWVSRHAKRCCVWQRPNSSFDSHVALHCLTLAASPSFLQLISGFFLCSHSLCTSESKGRSSVCGALASFQSLFFLLDSNQKANICSPLFTSA